MRQCQPPLPRLWLISDARNDAVLERAMARLPRGSGVIYRHYHLPPAPRLARFRTLRRLARARGLVLVWAGDMRAARRAGADGAYGAAQRIGAGKLLRLATAHDLRELAVATRMRADAVLLSPVWPTRSHPGGTALGPPRFRLMAAHSPVPVIALGGMTRARARSLRWSHWAAIDGLSGDS